jgi:predicted nuclease of predicted toxin-antitoxin system
VKLKTDENISLQAAQLLRSAGHDVATVREQNLEGAADPVLLDVCAQEGRALVTLDRGIGRSLHFSKKPNAGVAVLELGNRPSHGALLERTRQLARLLETQDLMGSVWVVEPHRVRIRQPPERT